MGNTALIQVFSLEDGLLISEQFSSFLPNPTATSISQGGLWLLNGNLINRFRLRAPVSISKWRSDRMTEGKSKSGFPSARQLVKKHPLPVKKESKDRKTSESDSFSEFSSELTEYQKIDHSDHKDLNDEFDAIDNSGNSDYVDANVALIQLMYRIDVDTNIALLNKVRPAQHDVDTTFLETL
eukprot:TRINITY_DN207_c2_g1_i2.p1 TRINITY_DN207_c2_g1~~TRINITY_DN207_c2_g1_i2.p1  ORF type:complete len:182 (-),score=43.06 TRINITY_DN207_c2_g1_i2:176-721(-)